uniref:Integrase catalytic domain-containing protein n=1 Tax=Tanacetum cinerariifolium TaxID=118510 RepID=A0A6L2JGK7_TANCI|nr:hypothetical protein [Tanacetum cinerariifolium]
MKILLYYYSLLYNIIRTLCGYLALWTGSFDFEERDGHTKSKGNQRKAKAKGDDGEGLYVRGRTDRRNSRQSRGKSRSKYRGGRLKCYIFQSEDHLKRNCPKNNCKKSTGYVKKDEQPSSSGSTYGDSEVMMVMRAQAHALLDWIMNLGCSYHMTPMYIPELKRNLISLETLKKEGYIIKLQSGKVKVINGSSVTLSGIRRDNCIYSLDGHAMADELNASVEEKDSLAQKQLVENQTGRAVRKLRTDNGLEFCNREFKQLCVESGIARHLTVVGMPQQNGLAERMNRTLMDKVRCLLIQSRLPKTFWVEATCTASYLINRSPSTAIEKKTHMEMWSKHPSDYRMLRIFGCVAYPHNKHGKIEPRSIKCVLLGYPEGVKGYKLNRLDNESPKIVTSGNVVFNESVMYKDTLKDSGTSDKSVEELQVEVVLPREPRTRTKPLRFRDESNMAAYAFVASDEKDTHEPLTYQEATACEDSSKWKATMKEEIDSLRKNKTYELVDHLARQKLLDVNTAFLHGNLEEVIYMRQPPGYEQGNKVCLLKKSLYGLKQSPRKWYKRFDEYMLSNGFKRNSYDSCVYYRSYAPSEYIYLLLYLDDMLIACKSKAEIGSAKSLLKKEFNMKELREENKILGMEIIRDQSHKILRVSQSGMSKVPYANVVGSLMYMMVCTRPNIAYAVSVVSRYLANPGKNHWEAVKWILKYLRGTINVGLVYGTNRGNHVDVTSFVNSNYAKDPNKGRSISGYAFLVHGYVVSWKAMLQHVVALSTTEAEYMALTEAVKEAIWLRGLLE